MKIRQIVLKAERTVDKLLGVYTSRPTATSHVPLKELGQRYGLEIVTNAFSDHEDIQFDRPSATQVRIYTELLASELALYPPELIKLSNVERLVLCTNLRSYRNKVSGITDMGLFKIDTLYLDLSHTAQNWDFSRRTFHHELFHAIDFSDSLEGYVDTEWRKLNPNDYKYFASDENFVTSETRQKGFITVYSTRSILEDKAELYSFMVVEYPTVRERCLTDHVLSHKVAHMKESLRKFSPHFDESFWNKIQARWEETCEIKDGSLRKTVNKLNKVRTDLPGTKTVQLEERPRLKSSYKMGERSGG